MRNRITLTITDVSGSTHYSLGQFARRFAAASLALVITALLIGTLVILWFTQEVEQLQQRRAELQQEQARLLGENATLVLDVGRKDEQLQRVGEDLIVTRDKLERVRGNLGDIEELIGLRPARGTPMLERIDVVGQTALEKTLMLQSVPGGSPVEELVVTSPYGFRKDPVSGLRKRHAGIDLRAQNGTPVFATADGIVEFADVDQRGGFGRLLIIVHNFGFRTYFGHLESIDVNLGSFVKKGDLIAHSGSSGKANGPHLHYEIRRLRHRLDPAPFLDWSLSNYEALFEQEERVPWDSLAKAIRRKVVTQAQLSLPKAPDLAAN